MSKVGSLVIDVLAMLEKGYSLEEVSKILEIPVHWVEEVKELYGKEAT